MNTLNRIEIVEKVSYSILIYCLKWGHSIELFQKRMIEKQE
jgi:hypothetical protein